MTGKFSEKDPKRCKHYAGFMSHLSSQQANTLFWLLFAVVLMLMCISSFQHHKSINLTETQRTLAQVEANTKRCRRRVKRLRTHYLSIVSLCFVLSITCTVMEVFALFNVEYCYGEDLIQLYWGFWSVLQVGSNIAIFGVMLQLWIVLADVDSPSWAVALGTPVLVFAALGWIFREISKQTCRRILCREVSETEDGDEESNDGEKSGRDAWISRAPTIVPDSGGVISGSPSMGELRRSSTA